MSETKTFTADQAHVIGEEIGIDWATSPFDVEQFRIGMNVELEHGLHDPRTNVSNDDPVGCANSVRVGFLGSPRVGRATAWSMR